MRAHLIYFASKDRWRFKIVTVFIHLRYDIYVEIFKMIEKDINHQ